MSGLKGFFLFRWIRSLKAWVESYADKAYSQWALFLMALSEAVIFPVPPDALLIAMDFAFPKKAFRFALICTVGSLIGAVIGYLLGYLGSDIGQQIIDWFDPEKTVFNLIKENFDKYGFWGVLLAAITPIPFKVFTVASGIFKFNFLTFFFASMVGRSFRFFAVSSLFYFFGGKIKPFVDKYLEVLVIGFTILLIGGVYLVKVMAH